MNEVDVVNDTTGVGESIHRLKTVCGLLTEIIDQLAMLTVDTKVFDTRLDIYKRKVYELEVSEANQALKNKQQRLEKFKSDAAEYNWTIY